MESFKISQVLSRQYPGLASREQGGDNNDVGHHESCSAGDFMVFQDFAESPMVIVISGVS